MGERTHRYVALDSWRGICALLVAMYHFPVEGVVRDSLLARNAWLFVDFFFVLSGFVIATSYWDRLTDRAATGRFILKRFGRLWPLHAAVLSVFVLKSVADHTFGRDEAHSVGAIFTNLVMIQAWGLHHVDTWNFPAWSISVEWFLYLVFAITAPLRGRGLIFGGLIAVSVALLAWAAPHGIQSSYDFGVFRGMAGFFTGALLTRLPLRPFGVVAEVLVIASVIGFVILGQAELAAPFVFALAVYVFAGSRGPVSKVLNWRPVAALGAWSYSIYLVHMGLISALWLVAPALGLRREGGLWVAAGGGDLYAAGFLLLLIAVASQSYRWLERPTTNYFKRLAQRAPASPPA